MQNAYANSRSVKHQRSNLLCCVLLRLKRSVNDTEPIKITGSVVKNIVIYKMSGIRLTGIAQILLRKMQNLAACKAAQIHAHQILSVLHPLVIEHSRSGQSELKILVSVVRFRPRPPFCSACSTKTCYRFPEHERSTVLHTAECEIVWFSAVNLLPTRLTLSATLYVWYTSGQNTLQLTCSCMLLPTPTPHPNKLL